LTLASLLILTGCFGLADDTITPADGEDSHTHSDNNEPSSTFFINTNQQMVENVNYNQTTGYATVTSITLSVYSAAVDPDGDNISCGWDIDLDGNVDYPTICTGEFTNLTIPIADWIQIPGSSGSIHSIAFIVVDEPGAAIAGILDLRVPYEDWFALYAFGAEDANGAVTDGTDDNLVRVTMSQGGDLNWASISVKISVDNAAPVTCDNPGVTGGACGLVEFGATGDNFWSVGDGVTIVESGQDLCTSGTCSVEVTINSLCQS
jgi:hypothetical protein